MAGNAERQPGAATSPLEPHRDDLPDQPALVALPVPRPYSDWGKITDFADQATRSPTRWARSSTG